jgi:hypothetical protein
MVCHNSKTFVVNAYKSSNMILALETDFVKTPGRKID